MSKVGSVKPSKIACETRFACASEWAESVCVSCSLSFCKHCTSRHQGHNCSPLRVVEIDELCEGPCAKVIANLADVECDRCNERFCWKCFQDTDKAHFRDKTFTLFKKDDKNDFRTIMLTSLTVPILLFDEEENFKFNSAEELAKSLKIETNTKVLVISIIGRTGEGKSHLLNQTFFNGAEIFKTDSGQNRCTVGAWAAVSEKDKCILIDTEGLQGESKNPGSQKRLLMKILAVSDLVIYRMRDSRLNQEVFSFISNASTAFDKYFYAQLEMKAAEFQRKPASLGPAFLFVHTTEHTDLVSDEKTIIERIKDSKPEKNLTFSNIFYQGFKLGNESKEILDYKSLHHKIKDIIKLLDIRAPRSCEFIFSCMQMLNMSFNEKIIEKPISVFPDAYFSCGMKCESCSKQCELCMNHLGRHKNIAGCVLTNKLENYVYLCKTCNQNCATEKFLIPKPVSSTDSTLSGTFSYLWSGFVLECDKCGVIFRSREYWFGNDSPSTHPKVLQKVIHHWPGDKSFISTVHPIGQRCIESVSEFTTEIAKWSNPALKVVKDGIVDACLPENMQRNSEIFECNVCKRSIDTLSQSVHHCRQCNKGVCDLCSSNVLEFPKRGKQRVCSQCFEKSKEEGFRIRTLPEESGTYQAYKVANMTSNFIGALAKAPISVAKYVAQPSYWQADSDCRNCPLCSKSFHPSWLPIHHCRACGKGVCDKCSQNRVHVPIRGIDYKQRVCDVCFQSKAYDLPCE